MPDDPKASKAKHWCDTARKTLTNLVRRGNVDIFDSTLENIKAVQREHWPHCDQKLLCNNFHIFAAAWSVEQEKAWSRELWAEPAGGKLARLYLFYSNMLADIPPPSPLAKPQIVK
jgi:hypothetical protein